MFTNNADCKLILDLDLSLRQLIETVNKENLQRCFHLIRECQIRRQNEMNSSENDQLYIPSILILRQFSRFQTSTLFDELLKEFSCHFQLIPICSKKILDDLLSIIGIIFSKRIMTSNDEFQHEIFLKFFHEFLLTVKQNETLFYGEFLGDFNRNLPIIGHFLSCLLELFEKVNSLDYRLKILQILWSLIYVEKGEKQNEHRLIIGQVLSCFLPGLLKSLLQNLGLAHQRLIQTNFLLLSYIFRLTVQLSKIESKQPIKSELKDLFVERNEQWLSIVDSHVQPLLHRLTKDHVQHENSEVRRALAILMLNVLCFCSSHLKFSTKTAVKTVLMILSKNDDATLKTAVEKLFRLPTVSPPSISTFDFIYEGEFFNEIFHSNDLFLSDRLLIDCQSELFDLLNHEEISASLSTEIERRRHLQWFLGYYTLIHQQIDYLFQMESFLGKFVEFIFKSIDFQRLIHEKNLFLNERSSKSKIVDSTLFKHFQSDVHNDLEQLIDVFLRSNNKLSCYLLDQIDKKNLFDEKTSKLFYLLSIIYDKRRSIPRDEFQLLLEFFQQSITDDDKRIRSKKKSSSKNPSISVRNLTIHHLLRCFNEVCADDLIEIVGFILLCHSSSFTILHQSSLYCLQRISSTSNLREFLRNNAEYIVDTSLRKCQTSINDGYLILIEFVRLGADRVINLPLMTHVIEQFLLDLSSLPTLQSIKLIFQFFDVFCQQVVDIVDTTKFSKNVKTKTCKSLVDFALELENQRILPTDSVENEETNCEKDPWHKMLVSIVDIFQHFISHSDSEIRSNVLNAFPSLAGVISTIDENLFLPLVHKLWPGLVQRFYDRDINIRIRCLSTIQCLCELCSDFVDRRIRQDILPILIQQLDKHRTLTSINTQEYRYIKCLFTHLGSILNVLTISFEQIEQIILILFQYLQNSTFASFANEQLIILSQNYSDEIWLKLILHDENPNEQEFFSQMKIYRAQPRLIIDSKWKSNLIVCLTHS